MRVRTWVFFSASFDWNSSLSELTTQSGYNNGHHFPEGDLATIEDVDLRSLTFWRVEGSLADLGAVRPYLITALRRRAFQRTGARWRYRRFARHGKSMKLLVAATVGRTSVRNCGAGLSFPSEALRRGQSRSPACGSSPFSRFGRS